MGFAPPVIWLTTILSAVGIVFLIVWELGEKHPIIDLHLFAHRNFAMGKSRLTGRHDRIRSVYFATIVLIPLWRQIDLDYTAIRADPVAAPIGVFGILPAPLAGGCKKVTCAPVTPSPCPILLRVRPVKSASIDSNDALLQAPANFLNRNFAKGAPCVTVALSFTREAGIPAAYFST